MPNYIGAPPAEMLIPVTKGCDKLFSLQRMQNNQPADFDSGSEVAIWIDIDKTSPTKVSAAVSGSTAAFSIQSTVLDQVRTGTRWRIVLDIGSTETALLVGKFERHDG